MDEIQKWSIENDMKTKKVVITIVIVCLAVIAGVVLYQKNSNLSPQETAEKRLEEIFKGDGDKEDEADLAALFMNKIQKTQLACALEEPSKYQTIFYKNIAPGLKKINYKVSKASVSGEKAEVTVQINYFKLQEIVQNGQMEFQNALQENDSLSTKEVNKKFYEVIAKEFQKGPSDDGKTTVKVSLHQKNHKWVTDDSFEDNVFDAVLQQ